jgi:hypothetical protein
MRIRYLVPLLLVAAQAGSAADATWVKSFSFSDPTGEWEMQGACALNPDAQVLVYQRDEHPAYRETTPSRSELVYFDLRTGAQRATVALPFPDRVRLAISADAQTVGVFHKLEFRRAEPMSISIWRPFSGVTELKDYGARAYELPPVGGRDAAVVGVDFGADPVFSPDARQVAFSGQYSWWVSQSATPQAAVQDAVGVLDLDEAKVSAIVLPFSTSAGGRHLWHLAWSANGQTIWVTAHGPYESQRFERKGTVSVPVEVLPADWTLFRCSVADRTATAVASVPPSILGIDPDGDVIVSDVDRKLEGNGPFWWHRTAFGLIPISELEAQAKGGAEAARVLALEAKTTKVVPAGGGEFRLERVFIGKSHTYVIGWLNKERVVLERASPGPQVQ